MPPLALEFQLTVSTCTQIVNMVGDSIDNIWVCVLEEGFEPFFVEEASRAQNFGSVLGIRIDLFHCLSHQSEIFGVLIRLNPCRNSTATQLIACFPKLISQNYVKKFKKFKFLSLPNS